MPGTVTSPVEIVQVTPFGIWLAYENLEFFLDFDEFPWFRDAPVRKILNVELASANHFYWPDLDIDLDIDRIEHPELYPLKARRARATNATTSAIVEKPSIVRSCISILVPRVFGGRTPAGTCTPVSGSITAPIRQAPRAIHRLVRATRLKVFVYLQGTMENAQNIY